MAKENYGKLVLGNWNTRTLVGVAVGAALFGVLMVYGSIPVFTNTQLTSAMIIPVVVGGLFGPLPAFVTLLVGNVLADTIGGWGYWFDWSIAPKECPVCTYADIPWSGLQAYIPAEPEN
jgi:energy-coupling factor transport system substrate-specific component